MLISKRLVTVAISILACLILSLKAVVAKDDDQFFLNYKTFKIRSSITRTNLEDSSSSTFSLDEFYSTNKHGQGRAKIQYENEAHEQEAVYYDTTTKSSLIFKRESKTCQSVVLAELSKKIFSGSQVMSDFSNQFQPDQAHFIGPIKLLSYMSTRVKDMTPFDTISVPSLKNHDTVGLMLELSSKRTVYLFYDKATFTTKEETCNSRIPLRISFRFNSEQEFISIDYKKFAPLEAPSASMGLRMETTLVKSVDDLALPVGYNCSMILPKSDLFEEMAPEQVRLSFVAHSEYGNYESKHFVAFDGFSRSMRIDMEETAATEMELKVSRNSLKLIDFVSNKLYTIIDDPTTKYGSIHSRLDPEILKREKNMCASTYALVPENPANKATRGSNNTLGTMRQLSMGNLLFGAEKFAYMGQARIRGIETEMYEAHTDKSSPFWFYQPAVVKDSRGKFSLKAKGDNDFGVKYYFNVVVYLTGEKSKRLIAMEVYDVGYRYPIMSVKFYDFVWDLSDSPKGDKIQSLFDHQDSCLSSIGGQVNQNKYAEVSLDLVANYNSNRTDWLNDSPQRQLAIAAGLKSALDEQGFMLYDLESKVTMLSDTSTIRVAFRTVQHPDTSFNLTFLGYGGQIYGTGVMPLQIGAQSPVDCFWLLDQLESKQRSFLVLYDERYCITDPEPFMVSDKSLNQSRIFELDKYHLGQVYRVDWNPNDRSASVNNKLFTSKINRLEGESVSLRVSQQGLKKRQETLSLSVRNIKVHGIDTVNHLLSQNDEDEQTLASVFPGYSLAEGQAGTWPLQPVESQTDRSLSLDQCQAACLVDTECKSFSFCNGWPQSTCLLSKFAMNSPQVSSLLTSDDMTKMSRGSRLELLADGEKVELIRDFKCELHHKLYTGLFERDWPAYVTLANQRVFKVANEDQCAERCFRRILDALEMSDELGDEVDQLIKNDLKSSNLPEEVKKFRASHEQLSRRFCHRFYYLDGSLDEKQSKLVENRLEMETPSDEKSFYCMITDLDYDQTLTFSNKEDDLNIVFKLDVYKFDPVHLYERQPGFKLVESDEKTADENKAQAAMRQQPTQADLDILKRASQVGKNFKLTVRSEDPNSCARLCLFQSTGLYPACQSFDFKTGATSSSSCQLNTMSLVSLSEKGSSQNKTLNIMETSINTIHFEPRFSLVKRRTQLDAEQWSLSFENNIRSVGTWLGSLQTAFICLVSIASGLIVGSIATERYMRAMNKLLDFP